MNNKRGLSAIVITLIIVLLSLAGIALVWSVVSGLIKGNTEGIEISSKCLNTNLEATKVDCVAGVCDIMLMRTGTETSEIGGVKFIFKDSITQTSSSVIDEPGNIEILAGKNAIGVNTELDAPDKVEVTPYFKDASGKEKLCSQTSSFSF